MDEIKKGYELENSPSDIESLYLLKYTEDNSKVIMTLEEILVEINRDRSDEWTDYDVSGWKEGLSEWTEYRIEAEIGAITNANITEYYDFMEEEDKNKWQDVYDSIKADEFKYMMLGRLKQDCLYFLGNGNGHEKHLWALNISEQISEMKEHWNEIKIKPEWISMQDIEDFEKNMSVLKLENERDNPDFITKDNIADYYEFMGDEDIKRLNHSVFDDARDVVADVIKRDDLDGGFTFKGVVINNPKLDTTETFEVAPYVYYKDDYNNHMIEKYEEKFNKMLEGTGKSVSILETSECYGDDEEDIFGEHPSYGLPMFEAYIQDSDEMDIEDTTTGRYCCLKSVCDELDEFVAEHILKIESPLSVDVARNVVKAAIERDDLEQSANLNLN